jgi:hypothetical protein
MARGRPRIYPADAPKCGSCGRRAMPGHEVEHAPKCPHVTGLWRSGGPRKPGQPRAEVSVCGDLAREIRAVADAQGRHPVELVREAWDAWEGKGDESCHKTSKSR